MGRELQKKKNRSSLNKVTRRRNPRIHKIKSFGSHIIAQNWDKNETLSQNYKRLGLAVKLNKPTGGVERLLSGSKTTSNTPSISSTANLSSALTLGPLALGAGEARIERDTTGKIINIIYGKTGMDRLDELDEKNVEMTGTQGEHVGADVHADTDVVKQLIERTQRGVKVQRSQSDREVEWIEKLVEKYGDDYKAMAWDKKLNPWQQSEGDIRKRAQKWTVKQQKQRQKMAVA